MNNAHAIVLRSAASCLRSSPWPKPSATPLRVLRPLVHHHSSTANVLGFAEQHTASILQRVSPCSLLKRQFSSTVAARFRYTATWNALGPIKLQEEGERGLAFGEEPLTDHDVEYVFGDDAPPTEEANRLLRVLHGRRVDGTLDLPLPQDLHALVEEYPHVVEDALYWLRESYEVDEDEAIVARIEREESGYDGKTPSQLRQRALDLKLYAPQPSKFDEQRRGEEVDDRPQYVGPQSGKYQAKLSEKGDVFGVSEIEQIRARNEAEAKREEEELDQQIEEIQAKRIAKAEEDRSKAIALKPEQSLEAAEQEARPPNEFEKWVLRAKNKATSSLTIDAPEIQNQTLFSRLWPSFGLVLLVLAGCYQLSEHWQAPKRADRLWPNMSLSFATITGIIVTNLGIFLLWRFPPAWGLLNRYFLTVPATPKALSLIGNVFSHSSFKHLTFNMLPLLVFGPSLHEDMGRGNFMALYMAGGVVGSFASLTHHAARRIFYTSSLGASGAIWAVTAAFFSVHSQNDFTIFFMPEEWKENVHIKGWMLFVGLILFDIASGLRGRPVTVDYVAHASGATMGWLLAEWYKRKSSQSRRDGEFVPKSKKPWWQIILQEDGSQEKGR